MTPQKDLGIAGTLAQKFQNSEITPLIALVGLLLGLFAVLITPKEEEPQISVTFANIFIPFPGASAKEVDRVVSVPAQQILSEIDGVKNIYAVSRPGISILTVRYEVGEDRTAAILRIYNAIFSNQDFLPPGLGVGQPLVKPKGIDDVPIVTLTLWSDNPDRTTADLTRIAHSLEAELKRVPGTRNVYTTGGQQRIAHVLLDPQKLSGYGVSLADLERTLGGANYSRNVGNITQNNLSIPVQAGTFMSTADEVADLVVGFHNGAPLYLRDVAQVTMETDQPETYLWFGTGPGAEKKGIVPRGEFPAVTLSVAKKAGTNAVAIAKGVIDQVEQLRAHLIPADVHVTVTRDYGITADAKASKLMGKLGFATFFVVVLVLLAMGWREAIIVGSAVILTLALTLFANWAVGFTLNRVSLFALIFSIGILVDDAIVVVENIHRHMGLSKKTLLEIIPEAVGEVGGPTILATFTVIAALLPMAFVTGLMGPYMSPIPINASIGMLLSLMVAFVVTPWLSYKGLRSVAAHHQHDAGGNEEVSPRMLAFFTGIYRPFILSSRFAVNQVLLGLLVLILITGSLWLAVNQSVVMKMLPFDNKSEFQVVVDMPEGTTLEETAGVVRQLTAYLATVPEVTDYEAYVGTSSPVGFNGLVRQYYLRSGDNVADIQVNLTDKHDRTRKSHEIARAIRDPLQEIGLRLHANVKVVEVPPGPPVQSPLVAEVYGPDYDGQIRVAHSVRQAFEKTTDIVDVDDSIESTGQRLIIQVDRQKAALLGISQQAVSDLLVTVLHGSDVSFLHREDVKFAVPVRMELPIASKADLTAILSLPIKSGSGTMVALSEVATVKTVPLENAIYHKDLVKVVYVTGDMAGHLDSPLYGMMDIIHAVQKLTVEGGQAIVQKFIEQPKTPYQYSIKWDGEWQVTYETFRDMGIAYAVGLLMIYLLVVAQFQSYLVPLIIMAPIPLTVIGVMPGHAILGAQFTATSMIGMIALAGIIVRNSILLVDFVNEEVASGMPFREAVIRAGAIRSKPIVLTGLAAMLGAFFILDDPIFSGLAISLIFGIFISTILTLLVIPLMYYSLMHNRLGVAQTATVAGTTNPESLHR
ncbi:MAG: efflux RND transporter permease subunit [Magnetococcales bacterium]|nr:efflux RND transporter permease subunit [Magnetococcales bacterium]